MQETTQEKIEQIFKNWSIKADERIYFVENQTRFMVSKFQEVVQQFDQFRSDMKDFSDKNENLAQSQSEQNKAIEDILASFVVIRDNIKNVFNNVSTVTSFSEQNFKTQDSINLRFDQENKALYAANVELFSKIAVMETSINNLKEFTTSLASSLNEKDKVIIDQKKQIESLEAKIFEIENFSAKTNAKYDDVVAFQDSLAVLINKNNTESNAKFSDFEKLFTSDTYRLKELLSKLESSINEKIQNIKIPSMDGFAKSSDLKELLSQIEPIRHDARNGYLKATNCDVQIGMINKKIETVQLTLKSQELNGG